MPHDNDLMNWLKPRAKAFFTAPPMTPGQIPPAVNTLIRNASAVNADQRRPAQPAPVVVPAMTVPRQPYFTDARAERFAGGIAAPGSPLGRAQTTMPDGFFNETAPGYADAMSALTSREVAPVAVPASRARVTGPSPLRPWAAEAMARGQVARATPVVPAGYFNETAPGYAATMDKMMRGAEQSGPATATRSAATRHAAKPAGQKFMDALGQIATNLQNYEPGRLTRPGTTAPVVAAVAPPITAAAAQSAQVLPVMEPLGPTQARADQMAPQAVTPADPRTVTVSGWDQDMGRQQQVYGLNANGVVDGIISDSLKTLTNDQKVEMARIDAAERGARTPQKADDIVKGAIMQQVTQTRDSIIQQANADKKLSPARRGEIIQQAQEKWLQDLYRLSGTADPLAGLIDAARGG